MAKRKKCKPQFIEGIPVREIRPDYYLVDFRRDGNVRRKCFSSLDKARVYCQQLSAEIKNKGLDVFRMTDDQRMDAIKAFEILAGSAPLTASATEYVKRHPVKDGEIVLSNCNFGGEGRRGEGF